MRTDGELAAALGVSKQALSSYRNGHRLPDPVQCATIAGLSGLPLAQVMGIVGEARAISREEKAVWRKLAGSVALLLCAIGFSGAVAPKALAHKGFATSFSSSAAEECLLCTRQYADQIRSQRGSADTRPPLPAAPAGHAPPARPAPVPVARSSRPC
ncbi:helix-turn-helix domain-containing protein [Pseudoxanthomonas japonensis]|uniref:helix-turn-helix domain-containing protein n=1 Tax=Pseudoxanthomonas japonensis TaxID=69284 RepID=UPI003748537D